MVDQYENPSWADEQWKEDRLQQPALPEHGIMKNKQFLSQSEKKLTLRGRGTEDENIIFQK